MHTQPAADGPPSDRRPGDHDVAVLGSANLDLVYTVRRFPSPGETVLATGRTRHPGGKGLNQAVAAVRAGSRTVFLGALGDDDEGSLLRATMAEAGIDAGLVRRVREASGTALITVQADGDNTIVVAAGANDTLQHLTVPEREAVAGASVLLAQLEVPVAAVAEASALAHGSGATVLLNAAPAQPLDDTLLRLVDVLVVNEHEAMVLTGADDPRDAAGSLLDLVPAVVVTLGAQGVMVLARGAEAVQLHAPEVSVVDSTGAGDTFAGVLAAGLAGGSDLVPAAGRAVVAASISTETPGAVPSIPGAAQVAARMRP